MHEVDGLNAGYASALLEEYLENPEAVPASGAPSSRAERASSSRPILASRGWSSSSARTETATSRRRRPPRPPRFRLGPRRPGRARPAARSGRHGRAARGVAAADGARQGVSARTATWRPDSTRSARSRSAIPSLEPERLEPKLTPELQASDPGRHSSASTFPARRSADVLPRLRETYCGTSAYEIEHISDHEQRVWLRAVIESGRYRQPLEPTRSGACSSA